MGLDPELKLYVQDTLIRRRAALLTQQFTQEAESQSNWVEKETLLPLTVPNSATLLTATQEYMTKEAVVEAFTAAYAVCPQGKRRKFLREAHAKLLETAEMSEGIITTIGFEIQKKILKEGLEVKVDDIVNPTTLASAMRRQFPTANDYLDHITTVWVHYGLFSTALKSIKEKPGSDALRLLQEQPITLGHIAMQHLLQFYREDTQELYKH